MASANSGRSRGLGMNISRLKEREKRKVHPYSGYRVVLILHVAVSSRTTLFTLWVPVR